MRLLKDETGFSLIEIVVASVILAAVLIPMIFTLLSSHNIVYKGKDYMVANNLIMKAAEDLKAASFTDAQLNETVSTPVETANYDGSKFTLSKEVKNAVPDKLKRVNLEIKEGPKVLAKVSFILYQGGL